MEFLLFFCRAETGANFPFLEGLVWWATQRKIRQIPAKKFPPTEPIKKFLISEKKSQFPLYRLFKQLFKFCLNQQKKNTFTVSNFAI
jgi:hypothetical protein